MTRLRVGEKDGGRFAARRRSSIRKRLNPDLIEMTNGEFPSLAVANGWSAPPSRSQEPVVPDCCPRWATRLFRSLLLPCWLPRSNAGIFGSVDVGRRIPPRSPDVSASLKSPGDAKYPENFPVHRNSNPGRSSRETATTATQTDLVSPGLCEAALPNLTNSPKKPIEFFRSLIAGTLP